MSDHDRQVASKPPQSNDVGGAKYTLPHLSRGAPGAHVVNGAVMYAVPPKAGGSRSEGILPPGDAIAVTGESGAQRRSQPGAGIASSGLRHEKSGESVGGADAGFESEAEPKFELEFERDTERGAGSDTESATETETGAGTGTGNLGGAAVAAGGNGKGVVAERTLQAGFKLVKLARQALQDEFALRTARKDTAASAQTLREYAKRCRTIDEQIEHLREPSTSPLEQVLSRYAHRASTFYTMRAALKARALQTLVDRLKAQDALQRSGQMDKWPLAVVELAQALRELRKISKITLASAAVYSDKAPARTRSKKAMLPLLPLDWRERFLAENSCSATYRLTGILLLHCGVRPTELQAGIVLTRHHDHVEVLVPGGKVRATAGQPWRTFALPLATLPHWVSSEFGDAATLKVCVNAGALRSHLARVSEKIFPRTSKDGKGDVLLSAYVFRHALATDMRAAGWASHEIAAALGEVSAETPAWYGRRQRMPSRRTAPVAIQRESLQTARPVSKKVATFPQVDRLGRSK